MLRGETIQRSPFDADDLSARLQAHGVEQLVGEADIWVVLDGSDLRKPHAQQMEALQRVRRLDGTGMVLGYRTLAAIGIAPAKRGLLYQRLFSSTAEDFDSESAEIQRALRSVGTALTPLGAQITWLLDSGFDDSAVWGTIWEQGQQLVCRVAHRERLVQRLDGQTCHLADLAGELVELATVETEMVVRKDGQPREKLQPVTVRIAAVPCQVIWQEEVRTRPDGARHTQPVWLVEVRLVGVRTEPWWLITDHAVTDEAAALCVFRMYRQRWTVEDSFKVGKQCLGWEDVQLLELAAVRRLVALGWVAAGFLYALGVTLEWAEVRLLARLGGWEERKDRPPGKIVLLRGLRRLFDGLATEAILADEIRRYGPLPPRIAAMLNRPPAR